ncbi:MAG: DUF3325 domain-containing protein [Pseudomonadota bacterium]
MMLFLSFLLVVSASMCLCLSLAKHFKKLTQEVLNDRLKVRLRVAGYSLLCASLVAAFIGDSFLGLVYWCGLFSVVAIPLPFIIAYMDGPLRISRRPE